MINSIDIHENALTCDYIEACKAGYHFKGRNGARFKIVYYTYANEWGDREHTIYARTIEAVLKKYHKATGRLYDKQGDDGDMTTEELAYMVEC